MEADASEGRGGDGRSEGGVREYMNENERKENMFCSSLVLLFSRVWFSLFGNSSIIWAGADVSD